MNARRKLSVFALFVALFSACMQMRARWLGADFVAGSGHKMCGGTGAGFLWGREEILTKMPPSNFDGEMIQVNLLSLTTLMMMTLMMMIMMMIPMFAAANAAAVAAVFACRDMLMRLLVAVASAAAAARGVKGKQLCVSSLAV